MSSVSGKKLLIIAIACGVLAALLGWLYLKAKESQYRAAYQPASQVMVYRRRFHEVAGRYNALTISSASAALATSKW